MTDKSKYPIATPENVWAALEESDRQRKENERFLNEKFAESDRQRKENERILNEKFAETDKKLNKLAEMIGGISNNQGFFAEDYFFNSFENGKRNFFGEKFDDIERRVKGIKPGYKDEYDILFTNGASIAIVEVKFKAHENDVQNVLSKAKTFRMNFPEYEKHQIYLGLASMAFYEELEEECIRQGIAIIKQVGDSVVINDEHLKVF